MEYIKDIRQKENVQYKLKYILVIVLFATLANADDWVEIAEYHTKSVQEFRFVLSEQIRK